MSYLHVRNWGNYQHYKDRQPVWIKLHVALLDDLEMRKLSRTTRLLWPHILLAAARYNNTLKDDPKWLGSVLDVDSKTAAKAIAELRKGRWLQGKRASTSLAKRYPSRAPAPSREHKPHVVTTPTALDVEEKQDHADFTKGLGSESMAHALRLLASLKHKNDGTKTRIMGYANKLPPAAFETVREKLAAGNGSIRNDAGYACSELDRMVREKQYA
jgi:hypothetical protein